MINSITLFYLTFKIPRILDDYLEKYYHDIYWDMEVRRQLIESLEPYAYMILMITMILIIIGFIVKHHFISFYGLFNHLFTHIFKFLCLYVLPSRNRRFKNYLAPNSIGKHENTGTRTHSILAIHNHSINHNILISIHAFTNNKYIRFLFHRTRINHILTRHNNMALWKV